MKGTKSIGRQEALKRRAEQYKAVKAQIEQIRYVMQGSVVRRTKQCGKPGCRCQMGPEYEHGPYYQWTRKIQAKTVTSVLTPAEARLYQQWIRNERQLTRLIAKMYRISTRAARYLVGEERMP